MSGGGKKVSKIIYIYIYIYIKEIIKKRTKLVNLTMTLKIFINLITTLKMFINFIGNIFYHEYTAGIF
jgi:hypothetical protein